MAARDLALREDVSPRRRAAALLSAAAVALAAVGFTPAPALAAPRVSLRTDGASVVFGERVRLYGRIRPAAEGERVRLVDRSGRVWARATTNAEGRFSARVEPRRRTVFRARWRRRSSDRLTVRVLPVVRARLRNVKLFARARVNGLVRPAHDGSRVRVRLFRNGEVVASRRVILHGRRYSTRWRIRLPGSYRAKATFDDRDHLRSSDRSSRRRTRLPSLRKGARGAYVRLLERRLVRLGYFLRRVNRRYDFRTADAVRAFHKVQRRSRSPNVTSATWRSLARPRRPRPRARRPRYHIEIDQTKQVLYLVRRGRIRRILHTSTGRNGITRDGVWHVFRKIAGYSPGRLYYPSYFDGLRAIHGWPVVPTTAASHGCARVPMWAARWIFRRAPIGTQVRIYH